MAIAERVGRVQDRWGVADFSSGGGKNSSGLHFGLCEVVWEWAKGTSFQEITKLTDVAEGTIVRVITRLDETCREVRDAARVIGDAGLFKKMEDAQARIKRDSEWLFSILWMACGNTLLTNTLVQLSLLPVCISRHLTAPFDFLCICPPHLKEKDNSLWAFDQRVFYYSQGIIKVTAIA